MPEIPAPMMSTSTCSVWFMSQWLRSADRHPRSEVPNFRYPMVQFAPQFYAGVMAWKPPSPRVQDLIRQCAQIVLNPRQEWLDEFDAAVLAASPAIASDPELAGAVVRS